MIMKELPLSFVNKQTSVYALSPEIIDFYLLAFSMVIVVILGRSIDHFET